MRRHHKNLPNASTWFKEKTLAELIIESLDALFGLLNHNKQGHITIENHLQEKITFLEEGLKKAGLDPNLVRVEYLEDGRIRDVGFTCDNDIRLMRSLYDVVSHTGNDELAFVLDFKIKLLIQGQRRARSAINP